MTGFALQSGSRAVISFANPKGEAAKTTSAFTLATQLSENGANVTIIDADPERRTSQ